MFTFTLPVPANAQEAAYLSFMVDCGILRAITEGEQAVIFHRSFSAKHSSFDVLRNKGYKVSSRQDGSYPETGKPMHEITISWSLED